MIETANEQSAYAVRIVEVGPRDGLQHEPEIISTNDKVDFINALSASGLTEIEAGSFVSPKAIPQLADSDEVFQKFVRYPGIIYSALVPNIQGFERARAAGLHKIAVFTAASETFTARNIHSTIRESIERFRPVIAEAKAEGMAVRGYISTVTHCPFEGVIDPSRVVEVMHALLHLGVDEISLGDTIGRAAPDDVRRLLDDVLPHIERSRLSLHFHDTYGMAVNNIIAAWNEYRIETFDASAGGLGGCPYAPGAPGNVATEDVVSALKGAGAAMSVDEHQIMTAARQIARVLGRPLSSRLSHTQENRTSYEKVP